MPWSTGGHRLRSTGSPLHSDSRAPEVSLLSLLPVIAFIALLLASRLRHERAPAPWREGFLQASVIWGVAVTLQTELLSLFRILDRTTLAVSWTLVIVASIAQLWRVARTDGLSRTLGRFRPATGIRTGLGFFGSLLTTCAFLIVVTTGVVAIVSPPSNWDSMTYHLPRVMHWLQNHSVAPYPTHIPRQLYQNPFAEFGILHLQALHGSDRLANLVQWFSMAGALVGITLIARRLGANPRAQVFSAIMAGTLPMGILQASSTQNDWVATFWLVALVHYLLQLRDPPELGLSLATGASLGLALLTKATAYFVAFPFMLWLSAELPLRHRRKGWGALALVCGVALALNLGYYWRNLQIFGNPLGPGQDQGTRFTNEVISPASVTSNILRNLALHVATSTPMDFLFDEGVRQIHGLIGIDTNDSRTTWPQTQFAVSGLSFHEDNAGNPLHILFIAVTLFLLPRRAPASSTATIYTSCLLAGTLLFAVFVRWQPWHSRLHLPFFVLFAAPAGLILGMLGVRKTVNGGVLLMVAGSVPWLALNEGRPLTGATSLFRSTRMDLYFRNNPGFAAPYLRAADIVREAPARSVGLFISTDTWEYPLFLLLPDSRLQHVNVSNASRRAATASRHAAAPPDSVIVSGRAKDARLKFGNRAYGLTWASATLSVYRSEDTAALPASEFTDAQQAEQGLPVEALARTESRETR